MSIKWLSATFETRVGSQTQKLVLLKLADNASDEGYCWPSLTRICRETELSERAVRNAIRSLESKGLLSTQHRKDGSSKKNASNMYRLLSNARHEVPVDGARDAGGMGHEVPVDGARDAGEPSENRHIEPSENPTAAQAPRLTGSTQDASGASTPDQTDTTPQREYQLLFDEYHKRHSGKPMTWGGPDQGKHMSQLKRIRDTATLEELRAKLDLYLKDSWWSQKPPTPASLVSAWSQLVRPRGHVPGPSEEHYKQVVPREERVPIPVEDELREMGFSEEEIFGPVAQSG